MTDPRMMYEWLEPRMLFGLLGEQTTFLNLGDWEGQPGSWDAAAQALARRLGDAAGLGAGQEVLDVGFGYGDQDLLWMERYAPARIVGLNVTERQVAEARRRVAAHGLADRIDLRIGSAVQTTFPDASFDRIVALESAMHFDTRERFFAEAFRLLRPRGRLALADIVLAPGRRPVPWEAMRGIGDTMVGGVPAANQYDRTAYAQRLEGAGFRDVHIASIRTQVLEGLQDHVARRSGEMLAQANPWFGANAPLRASVASATRAWSSLFWDRYDYIIATADKG